MHLSRYVLLLCAALALGACAGPRSVYEVEGLEEAIRAGDSQKMSRLVAGLDARDAEVREASVRSLAELAPASVPVLKETVSDGGGRAGPALLALGLTGDPDHLDFIRAQLPSDELAPYARQAERVIEDKLYQAAKGDGGLAAMEAYLEHFPDGAQAEEIGHLRRETLARASFDRIKAAPTIDDLRELLRLYPDTSPSTEVQRLLVTELFGAARTAMDAGRFEEARTLLQEVATLDPRRGGDVNRLRAEAALREGDALVAAGRTADALAALEEAARFTEVRPDAERRMARIILEDARAQLAAERWAEGVAKADQAATYDPALRPDVDLLKADYVRRLLARVEAPDGDHLRALGDVLLFGDAAVRPVEEYLATLFAEREHTRIEEVMTALGVQMAPFRGKPEPAPGEPGPPIAVTRLRDSLGAFIRSGFTTAITEVSRLFSSPDFRTGWEPTMSPLDPRRAPLVLRVEQISANYLGLLRLGLGFRALLGESGMEVITGDPIPDDQLRVRVRAGDIGDSPSAVLLTRVQLAGTFAHAMGDLIRAGRQDPLKVLKVAVTLNVPPTTPGDWMSLAEGVAAEAAAPTVLGTATGALRGPTLIAVDADPRQVGLSIYDPTVDALAGGTPAARDAVSQRTLSLLMDLARLTWGLYPGVDRVTVMVGTWDGRFEPHTRYTMSLKAFERLDVRALRERAPSFGADEAAVVDVRWTRWGEK